MGDLNCLFQVSMTQNRMLVIPIQLWHFTLLLYLPSILQRAKRCWWLLPCWEGWRANRNRHECVWGHFSDNGTHVLQLGLLPNYSLTVLLSARHPCKLRQIVDWFCTPTQYPSVYSYSSYTSVYIYTWGLAHMEQIQASRCYQKRRPTICRLVDFQKC